MTLSNRYFCWIRVPRRRDILFVASQNDNRSDGGLESSTRIFESLAERFDWSFVTTRNSSFTQRWKSSGASIKVARQLGSQSMVARGINYVLLGWAILFAVLRDRPRIIHVNDTKAFKAAEFVASFFRLPLLVSIRDTKAQGLGYDAPHWRRLARKAVKIIVLSSEMVDYLAGHLRAPSDRFVVISSIVDSEWFKPLTEIERSALRSRLGIAKNEFAIGIIGAVRPKKNQLELLRYVASNPQRFLPDFSLHFLGDFVPTRDPYALECQELVNSARFSGRVLFHGHQDAMRDWYCALDVVAIASLNEGLARAMIEAMSCGTPVVSFDVSSASEMLVESGAGFVVPQGDYDRLFDGLSHFHANEGARKASALIGRTHARSKFRSSEVSQSYERLYASLIES